MREAIAGGEEGRVGAFSGAGERVEALVELQEPAELMFLEPPSRAGLLEAAEINGLLTGWAQPGGLMETDERCQEQHLHPPPSSSTSTLPPPHGAFTAGKTAEINRC